MSQLPEKRRTSRQEQFIEALSQSQCTRDELLSLSENLNNSTAVSTSSQRKTRRQERRQERGEARVKVKVLQNIADVVAWAYISQYNTSQNVPVDPTTGKNYTPAEIKEWTQPGTRFIKYQDLPEPIVEWIEGILTQKCDVGLQEGAQGGGGAPLLMLLAAAAALQNAPQRREDGQKRSRNKTQHKKRRKRRNKNRRRTFRRRKSRKNN